MLQNNDFLRILLQHSKTIFNNFHKIFLKTLFIEGNFLLFLLGTLGRYGRCIYLKTLFGYETLMLFII